MKIDLLKTDAELRARRSTMAVAAGFVVLVGMLSALGAGASYRAATRGTTVVEEVGNMLTLAEIKQIVIGGNSDGADPIGSPDGRLNILLLGVGGDGHDGAQLTDTIILASIDRVGKRIGLLSIPRDLAYPLGSGRFEKINAVNAYAEKARPGMGAKETADALHSLLDVRIDRVIRIDFKGFEEFIDALGGIDVTVEHSFTDASFPTQDDGPNPYKWTVVKFMQGPQHMDGRTALNFVRSRHGDNGEGSDFARSRRQQLVIEAVRGKLLSLGTLSNPGKVTELWSSLSNHVQTNLTAWDAIKLLPLATELSTTKITSNGLTDGPDGELMSATVGGAFMLFPKKPDWSEVRNVAANPFSSKEDLAKQNRPQEHVAVEVRNGTTRLGLASLVSGRLQDAGYDVQAVGNATRRGYERTVIFDLAGGKMPTELARLKTLLDANVSASAPEDRAVFLEGGSLEPIISSSTNFLIILGESSFGYVN